MVNVFFAIAGVATWVTKYDETFGRCYSMELSSAVTAKGIINVVFVSRISIYVYLHHPAQKMDVDSKTKVSHPEMKEDPGIEPGTDRAKKDREIGIEIPSFNFDRIALPLRGRSQPLQSRGDFHHHRISFPLFEVSVKC